MGGGGGGGGAMANCKLNCNWRSELGECKPSFYSYFMIRCYEQLAGKFLANS